MAKKHEYINQNMSIIRKLVKTGDITNKLISDYQIYQVYKGYSNIPSKMDRYNYVAEDLKTSSQVVMRAIKSMESQM